jgi:hypothetical protein
MANKTIPAIQTNENNVGIGSTAPGAKLDVVGNVNIDGSSFYRIANDSTITAPSDHGLVAYYGFDEGSGLLISDKTGRNNTSSVGLTYTTTAIRGTALDGFGGNANYVVVPDSTDFDFGTGDFAVSLWCRPNSSFAGFNNTLIEIGLYTAGILIRPQANLNTIEVYVQNSLITAPAIVWAANVWYHIVVTRVSSVLNVYSNGTRISSVANSSNIQVASAGYIGRSAHAVGQFFYGIIDEVKIYKGKGLDYGEVRGQYLSRGDSMLVAPIFSTTNGNVGIGTNNPSAKLEVAGSLRVTGVGQIGPAGGYGIALFNDQTNNFIGQLYGRANGIQFTDILGSATVYIASGGNVGIGLTNPAFKLHVTGTNGDEVQLGTIGSNQIVGGRDGGSFGIATKASSNGNMILAANSAMYFRTNTSNESAYIGSNGNFGINTTNPTKRLHVKGSLYWNLNDTNADEHVIAIARSVAAAAGSFTEIGALAASANSIRATIEIFHHDCGTIEYSMFELIANFYTGATTDWVQLPSRTQAHYAGEPNGVVVDARLATTGGAVDLRFRSLGGACAAMAVFARIKANTVLTETTATGTGATVAGLLGFNRYEFPVTDSRFKGTYDGLFIKNNGFIGIGSTNPQSKLSISGTTAAIALSFGNTVANNPLILSTYSGWAGIGMDQSTAGLRLVGDYSGTTTPLVDVGSYIGGAVSHANWKSSLKVLNNSQVSIGGVTPLSLLAIGGAGSTTAASGITFGNDAQANLYRAAEDTIKTDGSLNVAGLIYNSNSAYYSSVTKTAAANWGQYSIILGNSSYTSQTVKVLVNGGNISWAGSFLVSSNISYRPNEIWCSAKLQEFAVYGCSPDDVTLLVLSDNPVTGFGGVSLVLKTNGAVNNGLGTGLANTITVTVNGPSPSAVSLSNFWVQPYTYQIATSANTKQIFTNEAGRVGIGTAFPVQKFQIDGTVGNPASIAATQSGIFRISNTTDNAVLDFGIRAAGNGAWIQSTDETALNFNYPLLLNPNGANVGIGTTIPSGGLHINNAQGAFSEVVRLQRNGGVFYSVGLDTNFLNIAYNGNVNANNVLVLTNGGYLGVGNLQNALFNLDIASTQGKGIQLRFDTGTGYRAQITPYWNSNTDTRIDFAINRVANVAATVMMSVGYDNNVGIGTTAPGAKLDVVGTIRPSSNILSHKTASYTTSYPGISSFGADATDSGITYYDTGKLVANTQFRGIVWTGKHYIFTDQANYRAYFYDNNFVQITNAYGYYFVTLPLPSGYGAPHGAAWDGRYLWCVVYTGSASKIVGYDLDTTTQTATIIAESATLAINATYDVEYADGHLYLIYSGTLYIYKWNGSSIDLVSTYVGAAGTISAQAITYDGSYLWATQNGANIYKVGLDGTPLATITTFPPNITGWAWNGSNIVCFDFSNRNIFIINTTRLRIDTQKLALMGGNVGIGVTNASSLLNVSGPGTLGSVFQEKITNGTTTLALGTNATAAEVQSQGSVPLYLNYGGNDVCVVPVGNGNVGIGITNPGDKFQVNLNSGENILANIRSNGVSANNKVGFKLSELGVALGEFSAVRDGTSYQVKLQTLNNQPLSFGTSGTTRMVIDGSFVGIGSTTPTALLNVRASIPAGIGTTPAGTNVLLDSNASNYITFRNSADNGTYAGLVFLDNNVGGYVAFGNAGAAVGSDSMIYGAYQDHIFQNNYVNENLYNRPETMRIKQNGRVGIGTNTPTTLLSVGGLGSTTAASGITFGGDTEVNLYRIGENILKTDGNFQIVGSLELRDILYHYSNIRFLNKAGSNWLTWFTRDTSESEAVARLDYIRSINTTTAGNLGIGTTLPSGKLHVVSSVSNDTVFRADGTNGTLFSVVDDLSDSLMSVNNSAGLPVLEVFADDRIVMGQYGSGDLVVKNNEVGIGTNNPINKLSVIGNASIGSNTYNVAAPANGLIVEGNLGIGTTNPASKLQVNGEIRIASSSSFFTHLNYLDGGSNIISSTNGGSTSFRGSSNNLTSMVVYGDGTVSTNYNTYLAVTNGNVGIGATAAAQKLDVRGFVVSDANSNAVAGGFFVGGSSHGMRREAGSNDVRLHTNGGDLIFGAAGSGSQQVTLKNGGNFGINITTPTSRLHVVETTPTGSRIQLGSISTSALMNANLVNDFLILTAPFNAVPASNSNNNAKWGIKMGGGSVDAPNALEKSACIYAVSEEDIGAGGAGAGYNRKVGLALHTSPFDLPNVERVRINNLGNVGIGLTNPAYRLQVSGGDVSIASANILRFGTVAVLNTASSANDIYANIRVLRNESTVNTDGMFINYNSNGATAAHLRFYANGTSERMRIDASNGYVGVGTTVPDTKFDVYDDVNGGNISAVRNANTGSNAFAALVFRRNSNLNGLVMFTNSSNRSTDGGLGNSTIRTDNGKLLLGAGASTYHSLETNGNVGIGLTNPAAARLHIKGDGTAPVLRVETAQLVGAAGGTAGKTFVGWMPIQTGAANPGDTVFIPLYK